MNATTWLLLIWRHDGDCGSTRSAGSIVQSVWQKNWTISSLHVLQHPKQCTETILVAHYIKTIFSLFNFLIFYHHWDVAHSNSLWHSNWSLSFGDSEVTDVLFLTILSVPKQSWHHKQECQVHEGKLMFIYRLGQYISHTSALITEVQPGFHDYCWYYHLMNR